METETAKGRHQQQSETEETATGAESNVGSRKRTAAAAYLSPIAHPLLEGKLLRRSLKLIQLAADRERAMRNNSSSNVASEATGQAGAAALLLSGGGKAKAPLTGGVKAGRSSWKLLRRGVHEVTKCVRKGVKGIIFFASDVFPIEIIAHLPVLCEENDLLYAYLCGKRTLGHAFRSQRPASVLMITPPTSTTTSTSSSTVAGAAAAALGGSSGSKKAKRARARTSTGRDQEAAAHDEDDVEQDLENDAEEAEEAFELLYRKVEKALRRSHPYF